VNYTKTVQNQSLSAKNPPEKQLPERKFFPLILALAFFATATLALMIFAPGVRITEGTVIGDVLGMDVGVTSFIRWDITFEVNPERRVPATDQVNVDVEVRTPSTTNIIYAENVPTDNSAIGTLSAASDDDLPPGTYDFAIKGISHLRKVFEDQTVGPTPQTYLDLTSEELLAGDSHPSSDNYINSIDIAYEVLHLYSEDMRADLNRDTRVNSLDFQTLAENLFKTGDE
jgi:hypothetical protein